MAEFLHDLNIHGAGQIQFKTTAGSNAGKIDQNGNDLVLSNAVGDIIIGNGSDDVFIGDGTNTVDIRFEQNMAIFADSSSTRTLTLGGANTSVVIESPTINGTLSLSATTMSDNLIFTTANGHIVFDHEPSGDTGEYTTEVALLKIDKDGTEKTILSRVSQEGALALGADDTVAITAGDTKSVIKANHSFTNENVVFASESGFLAFGFPGNDTSWSNRNVFQFKSDSTTASDNGLYIGDGGQTQFIDLSRNLKNIGTITASSSITLGGNNPTLTLNDSDGRAAAIDVVGNTFRIDDVDNNAAIFTADLSTNPVQTTFAGPLSAGSYSLTAGSLDINGNGDISGNLNITGNITNANWQGDVISVAKGGTGVTANTTWLNANSFANFASSSADWDTITTRGSYRLTGSTNNPFGSSHATGLVITQGSGDYGIQLFSSASTDNGLGIAYRYRGTSWQNWQYLVTKTYGDGRYLKLSGGTMSGDIAMGNNDITGVKFIQANGNVDIRTGSGEYAMHATQDGQTSLYHNGIKKFETSSTGIDVVGEVKGDSLDIDGNADISGTLDTGRITINSNSDNILNLNQTSSDNKWNYINFNNQGTRDWFIGQDSDGNFDLYNDNIDAYAITVSLSDNSIVLNDNVNVAGNLVLNSNSTVVAARKFTARDGNGVMLTADDAASGLSIADNGNATFTGSVSSTTLIPSSHIYLGAGKILYLDGGGNTYIREVSSDSVQIVTGGTVTAQFTGTALTLRNTAFNGNITASSDSTFNIGSSTTRFANIYADTLYGDGSNITNVTASNADTVDNLHASSFLRSDGSDTASGKITFAQNAATIALAGTNHTYAEFYKTGTGNARSAYLGFGSSGNNHFNIANEISGGKVIIDTNSGSVEINDNTTINADLTVTGNFTITGDLNTVSVTDLDVTDKTITVGVGQTAANSGSSGLIIDRSDSTNPSMLWNQTDGRFEFNSGVTVTGQLHTTGSAYVKGALYVVDTDGTNNHIQARSNGTEGFLTVSNGSNWGFIVRGPSNDPRIGAYYGGTLKIEGFHSSDGATGSNAIDFAQFQFGNDHFQMNAATSTFAGNLLVDKAGDNVSHIQLRRDTTADNTIVGDINWLNSNAEGTDDRLAVIRTSTQGGNTSNRGGKLSFFTRVGSSSAFRENSINQFGDWTFYRHLTVSTGTGAGTVKLPVGSSSAPSLTFINNTDSGIYSTDGTSVTVTVDGTQRLNVHTTGISTGTISGTTGTFTGAVTSNGTTLTGDQDISGIATNATAIAGKVSKSGDTMTGALTMVDSNVISGSGDVKIYARSTDTGASFIQFQNTSTGSSNSDGLTVGVNSTNAYIWQREAANLYLGTNDTAAVTIDSSQNATFAGDVTIGGKTYPKLNLTDNQGVARNFSVGTNNETFTVRNETGGSDAFTITGNNNAATFAGQITSGRLNITDAAVPIIFTESGNTGTGKYWRQVLDAGDIRFDVDTTSTNGDGSFSSYNAVLQLNADGHTDINGALDVSGNIDANGNLDVAGNIVVAGTVDGVDISGLPTFSTVGTAFAQLGDVSVASYIRVNADETLAYLNASQFLTAIGGVDGSAYLPLAGGTMTGHLRINDGLNLYLGNQTDLVLSHNGTNSFISNYVGDLIVENAADGKDLLFKCDNGTGGVTSYFELDGSAVVTKFRKHLYLLDDVALKIGNSYDLDIKHDGTDSYISNGTGNLYIINGADDQDIIFKSDDGSGGTTTYFKLDGSTVTTVVSKEFKFEDNVKANFGTGVDLQIYHNGVDSYIDDAGTGDLRIRSNFLKIEKYTGETMATFNDDNAVTLYYDNSEKLATTSTGIIINNSNSITTDSGRLQVNGAFKATGDIVDVDIPYVIHTGWGDDTSTTANKIIPLGNSVTEENISAADGQHFFVAPYAGSVKKIIMKNVAGSLSSSFTTELKLYINGSQSVLSGELTASSNAITWEPSSLNTFSAADTISLVYQKSATNKYWREVALTMVLIMDSQDI